MACVFISHSNRDSEQAEKLLAWLRCQDFAETFLDFDKHGGDIDAVNRLACILGFEHRVWLLRTKCVGPRTEAVGIKQYDLSSTQVATCSGRTSRKEPTPACSHQSRKSCTAVR